MKSNYSPKNNPRVIIIQKLYAKYFNKNEELTYPKHRFKKFIKDIVSGTIERDDIIITELNKLCGNPVATGAGMGAWRLPKVEYTEEELTVWKEEHQRAIEIYSRTSPGMGRPLK